MSSPRFALRRSWLLRLTLLAPLPLLGGCLTNVQPLYGSWGGPDDGMARKLQEVAVDPISSRLGHYLGDDLILALNGTGAQVTPKYHLVVTLAESSQTPLIDTVTGVPTGSSVVTTANFQLVPVAGNGPIFKGHAYVSASYDRSSARFADVRAARDAEIRNARVLADQIRTQLAAELATRT
ncbi:MAG TPA: LPS assembly lipoprotein LptE [Methylovirgula sp.]|nr:LPS assembly lipoprotein LptE [Methylovirgula sp.]